jgi:hypothetical protein
MTPTRHVLSGDLGNLLAPAGGADNQNTVERRKAKRTKMVLPVKLTMSGTTHLAHTCDLTYSGARVGGLQNQLKNGEIVSVHRGSKKANFKVVWVQQLGPKEIHVGLQALERQTNFWGVDLSEQERDTKANVDALMALVGRKS